MNPPASISAVKELILWTGGPACGVYFLCKDDSVEYVGLSRHFESRMKHRQGFGFNIFYIPAPPEDLMRIEREWIVKLRPPRNSALRSADLPECDRKFKK